MASLICRNLPKLGRQASLLSAVRAYSDIPYIDPMKGKITSQEATMPDGLGHAVGPERFELLAKLAGDEDPFELSVKKRASGTVKDPTLIPSVYEKRLVGCICEEDTLHINWMFLYRGEPKRCACGYFFKLTEVEYKDYGQV